MNYYIIILMNTILITTITGIKPVVSLYAYSLGLSPQEISMIIASSAIFPAFLALYIGKWVDYIGTRPIVVIANIMYLISLLLSVMFPSFFIFLIQLAMVGIASTCLMLALQKRVGSLGGDIDRAVANYSLFGSVGAMIGPIVSSFLYDYYGYHICIFFNMLLIAIALSSEIGMRNLEKENRKKTVESQQANLQGRESIWTLMQNRDIRNAILIGGLIFSYRELFSVYFPLLAGNMGISPTMTGVLLSFNGLAMLVIRFTQTSLVRSFGRMRILTWSLFVTSIVYLVTPFSPWIVMLFVLVGILGAGLGLAQPLSTAALLEGTLPERHGEVLGVQMMINRVSQFAIPVIFGGLGGLLGVSAIFWGSGLVLTAFGYITRPLPVHVDKPKNQRQHL
ncbi:MFS transporter [Niallia endozanthoxylica]|uniref:MFS transporter n=1 Tax=Niallia endozanthoxylica TaxID=2036016 RepID=A0A5J5I7Q3_9BACI|nr:MFS transporter [Niallia endozanthoxylica]KAA9031667.1 MFS transporter [Niallia endozanthoxylica]